jgi:hypothetical protein
MNTDIHWGDLVTLTTISLLIGGGIWQAASMIAGLRQELIAYKLEVAEKYVSSQSMREMEDRLMNSIGRLGDRLDRLFEK